MKKALPNQRERFIEAAREADCDESPEAFERVFAKVVPPKRPTTESRPKTKKPPK